jgi:uncharacterized protein (DUF433 family)
MSSLPSFITETLNGERNVANGSAQESKNISQAQPAHILVGLPSAEGLGPERFFHQVQSNFQYLQNKLLNGSISIKQSVMLDSRIMHGNPVFVGTRVPLYRIVEELADGATLEDLVDGYPSLSVEQIQAGLDFVASLLRIYE